jgi:hypothetical protein
MVRIHPDPPSDSAPLFNNSGWKVKLFSPGEVCCGLARASWAEANWVMYCIVSSSSNRRGCKHKRENFLFLCDALGDFALGCFDV